MTELIPLHPRLIGVEQVETVNARDLHAFLGVGRDFSTWIKERIAAFQFVEDVDFAAFDTAPPNWGAGNRGARTEYALTLDMAKELSMVERSERGKQARQYFIACERALKAGPPTLSDALDNPYLLRRALLNYTERVQTLETKVAADAPKVEFYNAVADAANCHTMQEAAKILGWGPNTLFKFLRGQSILMGSNLPYQAHIDRGHFRVVESTYTDQDGNTHIYGRTLVTGAGLDFIRKRIRDSQPKQA